MTTSACFGLEWLVVKVFMWYVNFTIKDGLPTSSSQRSAFIIGDVLFHSPLFWQTKISHHFLPNWYEVKKLIQPLLSAKQVIIRDGDFIHTQRKIFLKNMQDCC